MMFRISQHNIFNTGLGCQTEILFIEWLKYAGDSQSLMFLAIMRFLNKNSSVELISFCVPSDPIQMPSE